MITGKTSTGFAFSIEDHVLDNMELVDAIVEADEKPALITNVVKMILNAEQRKALYDHLRTEHGNVPIMAVVNEVIEIFNASTPGKN